MADKPKPLILVCCGGSMKWKEGIMVCMHCSAKHRIKRDDYFLCDLCEFWVHNDFHTTMGVGGDQQYWCISCAEKDWNTSSSEED